MPSKTLRSSNNRFQICYAVAAVVLLTKILHIQLYPSFYYYHPKQWGTFGSLLLLFLAFVLILYATLQKTLSTPTFLTLAVLAGTASQFGFAFTEGRGLDGLRDRTVISGHAEFASIAASDYKILEVMQHYEESATSGRLGLYAQSKPPGQLLFYMWTEELSSLIHGDVGDFQQRLRQLQDLITLLWPFVAALAALPIYGCARILAGDQAARIASGFYILTPSFNLVTLHTDQVLYPLLFMSCLYCFILCLWSVRGNLRLSLAGLTTGLFVYASLFFQLPLILILIVDVGLAGAYVYENREQLGPTLLLLCSMIAGIGLSCVVLYVWIGYDPYKRWRAAIEFHARWREAASITPLALGVRNIAEFVDWTGTAILFLSVAMGLDMFKEVSRESLSRFHRTLLVVAFGIVIYLAVFSRTVAEIARLWIFIIPVFCVIAGYYLTMARKTIRESVIVLYGIQWLTVYLVKITRDFW